MLHLLLLLLVVRVFLQSHRQTAALPDQVCLPQLLLLLGCHQCLHCAWLEKLQGLRHCCLLLHLLLLLLVT
jgi:hypothetical protein